MNQRLQESLTNEKSFARYNERLEEAWRPHEARIIREQARKDAQQAQATRDAAKEIIMFEKHEAERSPWIAASKMTVIQGLKHWQANRIADDCYQVPMIGLDLTRDGLDIRNDNQRIQLSSGYGDTGSAADVLTGEGSYMMNVFEDRGNHQYTSEGTVAPVVGIDDIEGYDVFVRNFLKENGEYLVNEINKAQDEAIEVMGTTMFNKILFLLPIGWEAKISLEILIFVYGVCKCAKVAYEEEIYINMQKYNCSKEEAGLYIQTTPRFVKKLVQYIMNIWLERALAEVGIPVQYQAIIAKSVESLAEQLVNKSQGSYND